MDQQMGIGVVGCGASVWMHGPAVGLNPRCRLVGWYDPSSDAMQAAVHRYGGVYVGSGAPSRSATDYLTLGPRELLEGIRQFDRFPAEEIER